MGMREKLIELLSDTVADCMPSECLEEVADYLIANGVTVPVKPEGYSFKDRDEIDLDYEAEDV